MTEMQHAQVPPDTLGWRIRKSLEFAAVPVEQMASELSVTRGTLSNWAHDRSPVRDLFLKTIALRCGVPYSWLKTGNPPASGGPQGASAYRQTTDEKSGDRRTAQTVNPTRSRRKVA